MVNEPIEKRLNTDRPPALDDWPTYAIAGALWLALIVFAVGRAYEYKMERAIEQGVYYER